MNDDYPDDDFADDYQERPRHAPPPGGYPGGGYPQKHPGAEKKLICGLLAILVPGLGIHKFVLNMTTPGIIMLAVTVSCSILTPCLFVPILGAMAMSVISIIEGILYLTKSDEEFYQTYMVEKKEWF
ncbi:TM2 domain-containing protein [Alienimonas chondri]|uniref:TM2 domain-containing protein n=1 Tax=Alienimonas chondri TaxID=2681879 RepID=A0ABX1VI66_9PLAN|nr:TM2 domain-containing protein [Alienimonas chondri]NNJ27499.1 hypothetical protein [Alienimonas chondri]